jgi:hypothetical protein
VHVCGCVYFCMRYPCVYVLAGCMCVGMSVQVLMSFM